MTKTISTDMKQSDKFAFLVNYTANDEDSYKRAIEFGSRIALRDKELLLRENKLDESDKELQRLIALLEQDGISILFIICSCFCCCLSVVWYIPKTTNLMCDGTRPSLDKKCATALEVGIVLFLVLLCQFVFGCIILYNKYNNLMYKEIFALPGLWAKLKESKVVNLK